MKDLILRMYRFFFGREDSDTLPFDPPFFEPVAFPEPLTEEDQMEQSLRYVKALKEQYQLSTEELLAVFLERQARRVTCPDDVAAVD